MWWRLLIALFLVLHGIVFFFLDPESWLLDDGRSVFISLGIVAAVALTSARFCSSRVAALGGCSLPRVPASHSRSCCSSSNRAYSSVSASTSRSSPSSRGRTVARRRGRSLRG